MSLIRCPGCRLDTSDSLAHCPNCGRSFGGSGPRLFEHGPAASEPPRKPLALETTTATAPHSIEYPKPSADPGVSKLVKGIGLLIGLVLLSFVPSLIPPFVMGVVFWFMAKRQKSLAQSPQIKALKIFVNEVSRAGTSGSKERPLDMLRRIEEQLRQDKGQT